MNQRGRGAEFVEPERQAATVAAGGGRLGAFGRRRWFRLRSGEGCSSDGGEQHDRIRPRRGSGGTWRWTFELKTVNAKGLDLRLRMPAALRPRRKAEARARLAKALARGTCFATLSAQREGATAARGSIWRRSIDRRRRRAPRRPRPGSRRRRWTDSSPCAASLRRSSRATTRRAVSAACAGALASLDEAIAALASARRWEGAALAAVLKREARAPSPRWSRPPTPTRRAGRRRCASGLPRASRR